MSYGEEKVGAPGELSQTAHTEDSLLIDKLEKILDWGIIVLLIANAFLVANFIGFMIDISKVGEY
jgi:hypothetical protein